MQPFMTLYRRGNSEELIDRMTDRVQSHRCMLHKESIRGIDARSDAIGNELSTIWGEWK